MSLKRLGVSLAMILALAGPSLFPQDAGPGKPDDIAAVFPEDTIVFAEISRPGRLYKDWKDYVAAFCTPEGKARVIEQLDKLSKEVDGEAVPEKLVKDIEKGGPSVQRVAVGLSAPKGPGEPQWAIVATAAGDEFFKALVDDLRVFSAEEITHDGTKILVIRKIGKADLHGSMVLAAAGKRLIVSSSVPNVTAVLDRAAGKAKGGDLRKNAAYASFSPAAGDDPTFRGFGQLNWFDMGDLFGGRSTGYRRASAHGMDIGDAVLGFRKIRGASIEATFRPGKIAAATRILVDPPCPIYDVLRQPVGPKDLLKAVPGDGQVLVHFNLRPGKELLAEIERMVKEGMELDRRTKGKNAPAESVDWKGEFEREVGVSLDEIASVIGPEVAFSMVGDDAFKGEQNMVAALLFLVSVTDAAKAKPILEKLIAKIGPYDSKADGAATIWTPQKETHEPVFALIGKTVMIGSKVETIQRAIKAQADGSGIAKQMPASISTASKLVSVRNNALWTGVQMAFGGKVPDLSKDLDLAALSTVTFHEEKSELRLASLDAGIGLELQAAVMMVPFFFVMGRAVMVGGFNVDPDEALKRAEPVKEVPPLPADQLAAQVSKHLSGMRSDEVVARTDAEAALKALGPQAAKLLADAVRKETDAEVKGRIIDILTSWKAYDAFPELLKTKVDGFVASFQKATGNEGNGRFGPWIRWREEGMAEFPWGMEPMFWDTGLLQRCEHHDLLEAPQGMRALAGRLTEGKLNVQVLRNLCAIFAFNECGSAGDLLVAAIGKIEDAEAKNFLQIALGWSSDPKARSAVQAGLKNPDVWMRRASFIAAERARDKAVIPALLDLLTDADAETRWNASYTLRELTRGKAMVNVYVRESDLKPSIAAARDWWEKNKATYKIGE